VPVLSLVHPNAWTAALDAEGVILNGSAVSLPGSTVGGQGGQLVVAFDSSASVSFVPMCVPFLLRWRVYAGLLKGTYRNIAQQLYAGVPGAGWDANASAWRVPCGAEVNIALSFGGMRVPLHPLDVVIEPMNGTECIGSVRTSGIEHNTCTDKTQFVPINNTVRHADVADIVLGGSISLSFLSDADYVQLQAPRSCTAWS
jgi:hypothetical protein